jgi:hypothetical protein
MNNIKYLYGLPIYIEKINPKTYEKNKIISQIENNYKISNIRNNWSKDSFIKTDIHHSLEDEENKNYNKINYYNLSGKYEKIISNFFKKLYLKNNLNYKYNIVNYTCSKHNSFMIPHIHGNCDFSLVHYINFDEKQHIPTIFKNPFYFCNLLPNRKKLVDIFDEKIEENSWIHKEWVFKTEEDDVVIFPAILEHYVRNLDSKKLRITISINIEIEMIIKKDYND